MHNTLYKSRSLIGHYGFTSSDLEDIRQELAIDLFLRLASYDPKLASKETFIRRVVDHKIATIVEARSCQIRDWRRCTTSLDQTIETEDGDTVSLGDLVAVADDGIRGFDLRLDIAKAMVKLTPEQQRLCEVLSLYDKKRSAKELGISRDTLYRTRSQVLRVFEAEGLSIYA